MNPILDISKSFYELNKIGATAKLTSVINDVYFISILAKFDEAIALVTDFAHSEGAQSQYLDILFDGRSRFVRCWRLDTVAEFNKHMRTNEFATMVSLIGQGVEAAGVPEYEEIDSEKLAELTKALIKNVSKSDIPEYAKGALLAKLKAVVRIGCELEICSDSEIRMRIKGVYADFCAEFEENDKKYESVRELILRWAKACAGPAVLTLAIGADVTAIAGLLPKPS